MENTSWIEISRSALHNNFEFIRSKLKPGVVFSHVVKGNAYGHGLEVYVPLALEAGAKHFSVFDAHEAHRVQQVVGNQAQILIMGMIAPEHLSWAIEQEVEFFVFEFSRLERAAAIARKVGKRAKIHLELETGMNRTGFEPQTWSELPRYIYQNSDALDLRGICTHLAGAENLANHLRVRGQVRSFRKGVKRLWQAGLEADLLHTACSAASVRLPQTQMDMVRIGILQYGFWPSVETYIATEKLNGNGADKGDPLKRLISWKSRVMSIKNVPRGEYIGYGTSFLATGDMKVASVPVGYSHGFSRTLSNTGRVLVRETRCGVIGVVNMNMMMVDVTHLDHLECGDEVVLIGHQGEQSISVSSFSDYSDQLNYELLTRLPLDIPRYVTD